MLFGSRTLPSHTALRHDETATLYPTLGSLDANEQGATATISGIVHGPARTTFTKRLMLGLLRHFMRVDRAAFQSERFYERIAGFLCDPLRSKPVFVRVGCAESPVVTMSRRNGGFQSNCRLDFKSTGAPTEWAAGAAWMPTSIHLGGDDPRAFRSSIQLLPPTGISVVSDIDDTVKQTEVECRRTMLRNTFLNDFATLADVARVYRKWAAADVAFHYVSSSPWQLFMPLRNLFEADCLPPGSFHLRTFRLADQMLGRLFFGKRSRKDAEIGSILARFPNRRFVLIGDSGEVDPEIYAALAQRWPDRVRRVLIRRTGGKTSRNERFAKVFRKLPADRWRVFDDASEIAGELADI